MEAKSKPTIDIEAAVQLCMVPISYCKNFDGYLGWAIINGFVRGKNAEMVEWIGQQFIANRRSNRSILREEESSRSL
ncbi:MAG: hypothetical protein R2728_00735 [Chitinophagales bacterium]